ncbi:hypothetical protein GIB67_017782 [Kingdonia uniflora]|uniref:Polygalacturonase n=1 Tax=Kingdonia uniflora TaxID=39325 RepID=A0A7J7MP30_9MAGN|nr:hypothetical protein GIB67_017782 [Kingdonia uniflora]
MIWKQHEFFHKAICKVDSIGSLGKGGLTVQAEDIHVYNVSFYKSTNGVRIKIWQGATGYARGITFEKLTFNWVQNPIIIDQNYFSKVV